MQENSNCRWKQQSLQSNIVVTTRKILHPRIYDITITYVQDIPKTVCNRIQAKQSIEIHPISMTDADYDYILDEIELREKIDFERNLSVNSDEE